MDRIDPFTLGDDEFVSRARGMCREKAIYVNRVAAKTQQRRHGFNNHIYKCAICGHYHLTSYPKARAKAFNRRLRRLLNDE